MVAAAALWTEISMDVALFRLVLAQEGAALVIGSRACSTDSGVEV